MAKNRYVNTKFWADDYSANLDPTEKLLFLYFLTNSFANICGIYEIRLKQIALDTGIDTEMVTKILDRFKKDGKMIYFNGWIAIKNFIKHQAMKGNIEKGVEAGLKEAPQELVKWIKGQSTAFNRLEQPSTDSHYSNLNINLNSNSNLYKEDKSPCLNNCILYDKTIKTMKTGLLKIFCKQIRLMGSCSHDDKLCMGFFNKHKKDMNALKDNPQFHAIWVNKLKDSVQGEKGFIRLAIKRHFKNQEERV